MKCPGPLLTLHMVMVMAMAMGMMICDGDGDGDGNGDGEGDGDGDQVVSIVVVWFFEKAYNKNEKYHKLSCISCIQYNVHLHSTPATMALLTMFKYEASRLHPFLCVTKSTTWFSNE